MEQKKKKSKLDAGLLILTVIMVGQLSTVAPVPLNYILGFAYLGFAIKGIIWLFKKFYS